MLRNQTEKSEQTPTILSNQVYETLKVPAPLPDPLYQSQILYQNKFINGDEVTMASDLKDLMDSEVGLTGTNVLVQLDNKMSHYRSEVGPWYVDSINGCIYIHNEKFSLRTVKTYVYARENGEVLSCSFRLVEEDPAISAMKGMVDSMNKSIGMVNANLNTLRSEQAHLYNIINNQGKGNIRDGDSHIPMINGYQYNNLRAYGIYGRGISPYAIDMFTDTYYNVSSRLREQDALDSRDPQTISNMDRIARENKLKQLGGGVQKSRDIIINDPRYPLYRDLINRGETKAAEELENQIWGDQPNQIHVGNYVTDDSREYVTTTYYELPLPQGLGERNINLVNSMYPNLIREFLYEWNATHEYILSKGGGVALKVREAIDIDYSSVKWRFERRYVTTESSEMGKPYRVVWYPSVRIRYRGQGEKSIFVDKNSLRNVGSIKNNPNPFRGSLPSIPLLSHKLINKYNKNRKKKLQCTLKVVGNPSLVPCLQIELLNVGKKWSGIWYIKSVHHSFENGAGYISEMVLEKKMPKHESAIQYNSINTQSKTLETVEPDINNQDAPEKKVTTDTNKVSSPGIKKSVNTPKTSPKRTTAKKTGKVSSVNEVYKTKNVRVTDKDLVIQFWSDSNAVGAVTDIVAKEYIESGGTLNIQNAWDKYMTLLLRYRKANPNLTRNKWGVVYSKGRYLWHLKGNSTQGIPLVNLDLNYNGRYASVVPMVKMRANIISKNKKR